MSKSAHRSSVVLFFRDRLLYIVTGLCVVGLGVTLMLLERSRVSRGISDGGTITYFIVVSVFIIGLWLAVDYVRQRAYYDEMKSAIERPHGLQASAVVQSTVTQEQRLVARLLEEQQRSYLNELHTYERQQELHNHFVLQWVHNMKTPIAVIDLLMQEAVQQMPATEEEQHQLVSSVKDEADRMTRGLEMLLYTARLDKFEIDLHIKRTPLHEIIRDVMIAHKRLCIRHSIIPRVDGVAWVETDAKWMAFVLNQLVSNAIKYSKQKLGPKSLIFRMEQTANGVKLSVIDEGIGIAAHELPRIFDPFFTGENGRSAGESTGMGLYLAKQVCSRLGHDVSVHSELGVSTRIVITFEPTSLHVLR
ncbi:sensor histidine kinase [Paenibacillus sp. 481]|uniref:sensor histidine kinase n=1 Tax=Paenibacillus sp. 481 TaxID=2835869 RepID=UPI001E625D2E|nr:sensor histidine kinase [Paenibacillus sp. 481]UHA73486.1 sensor histidine kinase [Paenibacillus sp. 481]